MSKKGALGGIVTGVVIVGGLILGFDCIEKVDPGYSSVIYSVSGGIEKEVLGQGWHFIAPGKRATEYSIGIEQSYLTAKNEGDSKDDDSFEVTSSDGKGLNVDLAFTYRFNEEKLPEVFTRFKGKSGNEVKNSFIKPNVMSWTKEVTARYPVTDILGDERANLNTELTEHLKNKFEPYGIIIESSSLININPDDKTREAIQDKVTLQQKQEAAVIEAKTAKINAEKEKEVALIAAEKEKEAALINAEQAKIKAQGQADATRIKAQAESEANKLIADSLTDKFIEKLKYERWSGNFPVVSGSDATIVNVKDILSAKEDSQE